MKENTVTIFRPYPFKTGQRIYIEEGPRYGDWEVVGVDDQKITLRCPISKREVKWHRFCYVVEESTDSPWPHRD